MKKLVLAMVAVLAMAYGPLDRSGRLMAAEAPAVRVTVDCATVIGPRAQPEQYRNNSILHAPPLALADRMVKEFGRPKIMRCWLQLSLMWDRKTDTCNFNFKIPRRVYQDEFRTDKPDGTALTEKVLTHENFEEYLDAFSRNTEELMLNIRADFEPEVVRGDIKLEKWKELFGKAVRHYKQRCPNLRYIEALNEPEAFAKLSCDEYYPFYRAAYEAVNAVNDELKPQIPLLVGGPCPCSINKKYIHRFLEQYASDTSPRKRLDFVSFHDYSAGLKPSTYGELENYIQGELKQFGLPTNLPIFMTEVGFSGGGPTPDPSRNLAQAAALTTYEYYARRSAYLRVFPWVLFHNRNQLCFAQFTQDLTMTPWGAAVKAWSLHKTDEIGATVDREKAEMGVYALASLDDTGAAIQVWNYQWAGKQGEYSSGPPATARVELRNLPAKWRNSKPRVKQYLIDSAHSNCFAKGGKGALQQIGSFELDPGNPEPLTVKLEPNAICLWLVEM